MQCLTLSHIGWKIHVIATEVGCSKTTVGRVLTDYDYNAFTTRPKSAGCPRMTTESDDRHLLRVTKANPRLPFHDITNLSGLSISPKTTARRYREVKLISHYARSKLFLTPKHKKDQLE